MESGPTCVLSCAAGVSAKMRDPEEESWIGRARAGDDLAFRWLLERYRDRVVRLAAHILRGAADAEDVAQVAFLQAFRGIGRYRGDGSFYTWLYHIVVRVCLDQRRLARWRRETLVSPPETPVVDADLDRHILVETLLDRLSPTVRAALVLHELEGLEYAEVAVVLGIPVGTVRSRIHAARQQFRSLWCEANREEANA